MLDAKANQSKQLMSGKEYDYIWDVDVGDGINRKLGYNNSENPYATAQEFLDKNDMSRNFLEQVAQFIIKNSNPVTLGEAQGPTYSDPLTGSGAYTTSTQGNMQNLAREEAEKRFPKTYKYFPVRDPIYFDTGNFTQIQNKIVEFNGQCGVGTALTESELLDLASLFKTLSNTSRYHVTDFKDNEFRALKKALQWPSNFLFPVLDLLRLFIVHPEGTKRVLRESNEILTVVNVNLLSEVPANQTLALRSLVNLFRWTDAKEGVLTQAQAEILPIVASLVSSSNKNVRLGATTLLLNYSTGAVNLTRESKSALLVGVLTSIEGETEQENLLRSMVTLGNLVFKDEVSAKTAKEHGALKKLSDRQDSLGEKCKECAAELQKVIS